MNYLGKPHNQTINYMLDKLPFELILASGSPRRKTFLEDLNIPFSVDIKPVDESYPFHLQKEEIPLYLSDLKANAFNNIGPNQVILTGDTVVWHKNIALGKPSNYQEAFTMLSQLSGTSHEVISAFCLKTRLGKIFKSASCKVYFKDLTEDEINFYITNFEPYDKAGGYGIQEWIGQIGITNIKGSFYTVMGLPIDLLYQELIHLSRNWKK